ncbi:hypothetical protein PG989_006490 [Apiospora arundinis]
MYQKRRKQASGLLLLQDDHGAQEAGCRNGHAENGRRSVMGVARLRLVGRLGGGGVEGRVSSRSGVALARRGGGLGGGGRCRGRRLGGDDRRGGGGGASGGAEGTLGGDAHEVRALAEGGEDVGAVRLVPDADLAGVGDVLGGKGVVPVVLEGRGVARVGGHGDGLQRGRRRGHQGVDGENVLEGLCALGVEGLSLDGGRALGRREGEENGSEDGRGVHVVGLVWGY